MKMKPRTLFGTLRFGLLLGAITVALPAASHTRPLTRQLSDFRVEKPSWFGTVNRPRVALPTNEVVSNAMVLIGIPYRWGGNTPESGLDCSGFVRYVYNSTHGIELPRRAIDMVRAGELVAVNDLQPGDLVFFKTKPRTISHVGIYIGNDRFVHAPSTGQSIRVDSIHDTYWGRKYAGARRIDTATA